MLSFYVAVMISHGQIKKTIGEGFYKSPEQCYIATQWPSNSYEEEYKCIKAQGKFVSFDIKEK